ncbi:MAG: Crp/Fnr family transcriptional regulator [Chloroflexi bacterium]|nr:Crp/Fnr family transcriptional regulator [Chloroflexota bacterium]
MYMRLRKVRGRRGQTYTYLEIVSSERQGGQVRQKRVCSLGRVDELRRSGALDRMIGRLFQVAVERPAMGEPSKAGPAGIDYLPSRASRTASGLVQDLRVKSLRASPVFADVNEEELGEIAGLAAERDVKAGEFLFTEGDVLEYLYIVAEGRMKFLRHSPSGRDFVIAFGGPGEIFGNAALYAARAHPNSAQAVLDTRVLAFKNDDFLSFLASRPELGFRILRRMLNIVGLRLMSAMRRLTDLAAERAESRLAYTLIALSVEFGLTLPFTREEVAQMAGTTTETAVRFVNRLKKAGVVGPARRKIPILDRQRLWLLVGNPSLDGTTGPHPPAHAPRTN